ncbi:MAG TPA: transglycosylase SLT domain-containing protein [Terriglobia bacterium]|nr:transglycosylase SLT domain-containing protein [Terriglobia bacterium]
MLRRPISQEWVPSASKLSIVFGILSFFFFLPMSKALLQSEPVSANPSETVSPVDTAEVNQAPLPVVPQPTVKPVAPADRAAINAVENLLARYDVDKERISRTARAIVASGRRHKVEPRLLASIMIVESGANPYAVSSKGAIGAMQIHLPTWGAMADEQGINLFKLEDNVDLGARILGDYIAESGVWEGVMRYKGFFSDNPASQQSAADYARKVRRIYDS